MKILTTALDAFMLSGYHCGQLCSISNGSILTPTTVTLLPDILTVLTQHCEGWREKWSWKQRQEEGLEGPVWAPHEVLLCPSLSGPCLHHQLLEEGNALGVWEGHQKEGTGEQPG